MRQTYIFLIIQPWSIRGFFYMEIRMNNYFTKLNSINVSEHIEKKGQFSYLSWPYAVAQLRQADPTATWHVARFDGLPYLKTDCGYFVEVGVVVEGVKLSQIHPVLDARNKPIEIPSAFDINTSIQRCRVKAIALHGLGLYIYAGEDLPEGADQQRPVPATEFVSAEQIARIKALLTETGQTLQRLLGLPTVEVPLSLVPYQQMSNSHPMSNIVRRRAILSLASNAKTTQTARVGQRWLCAIQALGATRTFASGEV